MLTEYEATGQCIAEEWWECREKYYEALRLKERAELDGSEPDKRISKWWLTVCWDDWYDIDEWQKQFAEVKRKWMIRALQKQADEIHGLKVLEMV